MTATSQIRRRAEEELTREVAREQILAAISRHAGNRTMAAGAFGLTYQAFRRVISLIPGLSEEIELRWGSQGGRPKNRPA